MLNTSDFPKIKDSEKTIIGFWKIFKKFEFKIIKTLKKRLTYGFN